jgi:DNA-binding XRE family transcriptional regulator
MNALKIKELRHAKKMTQAAFAGWLGVKLRTVIAWENDQNPIPEWAVKRLEEPPAINPQLPMDVVVAASNLAAAQGVSLDRWIADAMRAELARSKHSTSRHEKTGGSETGRLSAAARVA